MKLYHGSSIPGITALKPLSFLHGKMDNSVVYLSGNLPYALFYIWDSAHNKTTQKYVTCRLRDDLVIYEEQFPDQLKTFYQGVSGYIYEVESNVFVEKTPNREHIYVCRKPIPVSDCRFIPDVYDEILRRERAGQIRVIRYPEMPKEQLKLLHDHIVDSIRMAKMRSDPNSEQAQFYATYFPALWEQAT